MADIFTGRGSRQFPTGTTKQPFNPVRVPRFRDFREQSGGFFNRSFPGTNDSFEDIFGTGEFSFNTRTGGSTAQDDGRQFDEGFGRGLFQDDPGLAFETVLGQSGQSRGTVDIFRKNASRFLSQFQGALGNQILELGRNDLNPLDFFQGLDLDQELQRLSPSQRGANNAGLNRASRILF